MDGPRFFAAGLARRRLVCQFEIYVRRVPQFRGNLARYRFLPLEQRRIVRRQEPRLADPAPPVSLEVIVRMQRGRAPALIAVHSAEQYEFDDYAAPFRFADKIFEPREVCGVPAVKIEFLPLETTARITLGPWRYEVLVRLKPCRFSSSR
jgi:hypothetical protein